MGRPRVRGSVNDRLAAAEAAALVGRVNERARLIALLAPEGPAAVFVHGPGGIAKTTLVSGTLASLSLTCVSLDGRQMEPTVPGALGIALEGSALPSVTAVAEQVAAAAVDVLVIDSFERLNLLDGWIRNELICVLPAALTTVPRPRWRRWSPILSAPICSCGRPSDVSTRWAPTGPPQHRCWG